MRSSNPALTESTFTREPALGGAPAMTIRGAVHKSTLLVALCSLSAAISWKLTLAGPGMAIAIGGAILGFIIGLVLCFRHTWAPLLAPAYAVAQGLFLGGISAVANAASGGIVLQAVALTFGVLFALLA
ncbi:MAG: Bax inhibitor-1/YccA family protein, partial [Chthoniobacteraceae bacterium]